MCGIVGFVGEGDERILAAMVSRLQHRGPDAEGRWSDPENRVFLGHRRLSIVDIEGGAQPMWTQDKKIGVVFNGEIYNHAELRTDLIRRGHRFLTDHSDTEVLLHGYREWGEDLALKLNGMWAIALYDRTGRTLWLSRDRFGEKPLYYARKGSLLAFSSELPSLTAHPELNPTLSLLSVQKYLAFGFIPAPNSIYEEVRKLPAGHNLRFDITTGSSALRRYWEFELDPLPSKLHSDEEYGDELRHLLSRSVAKRLMSDVPIGVLLSGGIDSSAIAFLAARHSADPIKTFSIGFTEKSFDESTYARKVAAMIGSDHHTDQLRPDSAIEIMAEALTRLDEPMADPSLLPCYLLFRGVSSHVKVTLGGDGGDELFAGYDTFQALRWAELYHRVVPARLNDPIRLVAGLLPVSHRNMSLDFRVKRFLRGLSAGPAYWTPAWIGPLSPTEVQAISQAPVDLEAVYEEALLQWESCRQENLIDRTIQFYTKLYLQDDILPKIDRTSMMHSVEARSPFLDYDLVNFVRRLPSDMKLRGTQTKYILKKAFASTLPDWLLNRPKKGFGIPVGQWMVDGKIPVQGRLGTDCLFRPDLVDRWAQEHIEHRADHRSFLWARHVLDRFLDSRNHLPIPAPRKWSA